MERTYQSRCMKENTDILGGAPTSVPPPASTASYYSYFPEEIVSLRQQQAELLGYKDHATYIQEVAKRLDHKC